MPRSHCAVLYYVISIHSFTHLSYPRGYGSIFLKMADNFKDKILLKKIVKSVSYSRYGVRVTTVDGEMFTGKYGLCTFSTGVLSSDSVVFSPKLPQWKVEAIN